MTDNASPLHALRPFPDNAARSYAACSATPYDGGHFTDTTLTTDALATIVQNAAKAYRILTFTVDVPWVDGETATFVWEKVDLFITNIASTKLAECMEVEDLSETQMRFTIPLYLETEHT